MTQKRLLSFAALTFLIMLSLSILWEFALEDVIEPVFLPDHLSENLRERWESVTVTVGLIALALIIPTWLALKSNLARQQAEAIRNESEARFRDFAEGANDWIWEMDADLRYTYVSPALEQYSGLPAEGIIGHTRPELYARVLPDLDAQEVEHWQEFNRLLEARRTFRNFEHRWVRPDGEVRYFLTSAKPVYGEQGKFAGYRGVGSDITELKRRDEDLRKELERQVEERTADLRESEERLRLLTDALPVLISYVDKDLRYQFNNRAYETWFGISREDIRDREVREVLGDAVYGILREYIDRVLIGETVNYESRAPYKDGGERDIRGTYVPDFGQDGTVKGFYVLVEDITENKRLEQQLVQSEQLATLGKLTATVSHELRNPLGTIRNSLVVVDAKARDRALGIEGTLDRAMRSISRCNGIIDELFDYATFRHIRLQDTSLDTWLAEVLDDLAVPEGVTVRRTLGDADTKLAMDRERMRRVMINLCDNACQAMTDETDEEGVDKERIMTIGTEAAGNEVKIFVTDAGTGMSKDTVAQIFEPLFSTKIFGVGLGLSIVKQIVEQHAGTIEVTSEEGQGTRFVVRLPMVRAGGEAS